MEHINSARAVLSTWCAAFSAALERRRPEDVVALFDDHCFWRDLIAFTWNVSTLEGRSQIAAMLAATLNHARPRDWCIEGEPVSAGGVTEGWLSFETSLGRGRSYVRLRSRRCWTLLTSLYELTGHEEPRGRRRPADDAALMSRPAHPNWLDLKRARDAELGSTTQPYVVIVGGGQAGLGLGARLKMLQVPALILDRHPRPGDQWRSRYKSLSLHDPVWFDHMPYLPFPDHWPVYTPKDKMGDWLEAYASIMELNIWSSTECTRARYNDNEAGWIVEVTRDGESRLLRPKHLVFATGNSGVPKVPNIRGASDFAGVQYHSSSHPGGSGFDGKRVVVIGANNSAHDICADLWQNGADVTMIQRSSTLIVRSKTLMDLTVSTLYSEDALERGITTEMADLVFASIPLRLLPDLQRPVYEEMARRDADFYRQLKAAGFMLDFAGDGSGLWAKYLRRGSGYYIDVGASQLIVDGRISLRSGVGIDHIERDGVVLSDASKLPADAIIYATGFGSMEESAAKLTSPALAETIGRCWGYGSNEDRDPGPWEGELRNMWKPTKQPGLWFHGGNLYQSRQYSLFLALQLKARLENMPIRPFGIPEPMNAAGALDSARTIPI